MSQSSGQFSGQYSEYGSSSYGYLGHPIAPTGSIDYNSVKRSLNDRQFYWQPSDVYEFVIPATGTTGGKFELTAVDTYEFGITPDLGWYITEDLFKPYSPLDPYRTNSQLILKSNLSVDNGNIAYSNASRKLYITLSEDDMQALLYLNFGSYVWSVRGKTKNGTYTQWSAPRRFAGYYQIPDTYVTVDERVKLSNKRTVTLRGKKNDIVSTVAINSVTGLTRYPNQNTWEYDVLLTGGNNLFYIKGITNQSIETPLTSITVLLATGSLSLQKLYNTFDDFGSLAGVERLPYEANNSYKTRIKDVFIHPAESNLLGLTNSIARNLNLTYDDEALVIKPASIENRFADEVYPGLHIEIDTNTVYVGSQSFYSDHEYHLVDPQDMSIDLRYKVNPLFTNDLKVYSSPGNLINSKDYLLENGKLKFYEPIEESWVSYNKYLEIDKSISKTVYDIYTGLTNLSYENRTLFTVTTGTANGSADGLLKGRYIVRSSSKYIDSDENVQQGTPIKWVNFSLNKLVDPNYQARYTGEFGDLLNSKIESFVKAFKNKSHISFDKLVCDVDVFDPIDEDTESSAYIPGVLDPVKGYWKSTNPTENSKFSTAQAIEMDFISPKDKAQMEFYGLKAGQFKSGIGDNDDLKIVISNYTLKEDIIKPDIFRATLGFESTGQASEASYLPNTVWGAILFEGN